MARAGKEAEEGIQLCERAVELLPSLPAAHYNLARAYELSDDWRGALLSYERAVELQPSYDEAFVSL